MGDAMRADFRKRVLLGVAGAIYCVSAYADPAPPPGDNIQTLIADINAHEKGCAPVTPKQTLAYQQCKNEEATLIQRQKNLGVTDKTVKDSFKTRGWRWPT
jgi:hypothetical protein